MPFIAEALIISIKLCPATALEKQEYVIKNEQLIENDLTENLLGS